MEYRNSYISKFAGFHKILNLNFVFWKKNSKIFIINSVKITEDSINFHFGLGRIE